MKTFRPIPDLTAMMKWPGDHPPALTRFVGFHAMRGETKQTLLANLILLALALFILWGYWPLFGL